MSVIVRQMEEKDYEAFVGLYEEAYSEYLDFLKNENPRQYLLELQERTWRRTTPKRLEFYLKTGSSFVAEQDREVVGYVVSQTIDFMHGVDKLLWIEYVVVKWEFRRQGVGLALMSKLIEYAKRSYIDRIYSTINPDNEASIKLHIKSGFNVRDWKTAVKDMKSV